MTDEQVEQILEQQQIIMDKLSKSKEKDKWDKLSTLSTFLSAIVIGVIGVYFTVNFKAQEVQLAETQVKNSQSQLQLAEAQVAAGIVRILSGPDEAAKKGALLTISALNNKDLAVRLATFYPSAGTIEAMEILYQKAEGENKHMLRDALIDALYNRIADLNTNNQNYNQVIKDCTKILDLKSSDDLKLKNDGYFLAECYRSLGFAYFMTWQNGPALDWLNKSLEVIPSYDKAFWSLGYIYWKREDQDQSNPKALEYYNLAVQNKASSSVFLELGQLHLDMGNIDKSIEAYGAYIKSSLYDYKGYYELAKAYKQQGQPKNYYYNLKKAQSFARTQTHPPVDHSEMTQIDQEIEEAEKETKTNNINNVQQVKRTSKAIPPKPRPRKSRTKRRF